MAESRRPDFIQVSGSGSPVSGADSFRVKLRDMVKYTGVVNLKDVSNLFPNPTYELSQVLGMRIGVYENHRDLEEKTRQWIENLLTRPKKLLFEAVRDKTMPLNELQFAPLHTSAVLQPDVQVVTRNCLQTPCLIIEVLSGSYPATLNK